MPKPDKLATPLEPTRPSESLAGSYQPALPEANARYAEYLRALDEVPVLLDVVSEPPRSQIRDFRLGQRPNVRKAAREDAYLVRRQQAEGLADSYAEYAAFLSASEDEEAATANAAAKKKAKRSKSGKRGKRRKR